MRHGRQHRSRPGALYISAPFVEFLKAGSELVGIPTNFVKRHHAIEGVEGGILDALRHHGRRGLLETHRKLSRAIAGNAQSQNFVEKIKKARIQIRPVQFRFLDRSRDMPLVVEIDRARLSHVGSIHTEACQRRAQSLMNDVTAVVAMQQVVLTYVEEQAGEAVDIAAERFPHSQLLLRSDYCP